jgi:hypothetical protein
LPEAKLYIVKDVLQHWPIREIRFFLSRMKGRCMLITNTIGQPQRPQCARTNSDIGVGGFRPLDLALEPFRVPDIQVCLDYEAVPGDFKRTILVSL